MFDKNFYPTPPHVLQQMCKGLDLIGKTIYDPEAGKGDIIDFCAGAGAAVLLATEIHPDLRAILASKCTLIGDDFLNITSAQISHVDFIIMNPPFDVADKHILHAYDIAPGGCQIIALCNTQTLSNTHTHTRKQLQSIIETCATVESLGQCFQDSERSTGVEVSLIRLTKEGQNYKTEFEGFFMEEEPEQPEGQAAGLMSYNAIRDLVHRYIMAVKIFDEQLLTAQKLHSITHGYFIGKIGFRVTKGQSILTRAEFKKDLQRASWQWVFDKMDMERISTRSLKEDINTFIEKQSAIPFTMKNIFHMLDLVLQTTSQRMDKAILDVFDRLTKHYNENRYNVPGWKTNSAYLMGQKFILPNMCGVGKYHTGNTIDVNYCGSYFELIEDLLKAMCWVTGDDYKQFLALEEFLRYPYKLKGTDGQYIRGQYGPLCFSGIDEANRNREEQAKKGITCVIAHDELIYGKWFNWSYFEIKAFKKGTVHFVFKSADVWARFNQRVAKIKGYPLFEHTHTKPRTYTHTPPKRAESAPPARRRHRKSIVHH